MTKVLFLNTGPWGTGSFTAIKGLSKQLLKLGHEVKIFFPDTHMESVDMGEYYSNPSLYHIWDFPISNGTVTLSTFPLMLTDPHPRNPHPIMFHEMSDEQVDFYLFEMRKELVKIIQSFKPDVIECHHIWYASWILQDMGYDYIVTAHHSDQMGFKLDSRVQPYAIAGAKSAKKILAISKPVKEEVVQLYGVPKSKVMITKNGYDKDIFRRKKVSRKAVLEKFGLQIPTNADLITFVGKLSINKGVNLILQANKILAQNHNVHFIMMGAGEVQPILDAMPEGSYSLENTHFIGHQPPDDVADFHNISKLSIMPSRSEGFGISCLEAMACGLPVVVTKSGGPEFFAVGEIIDIKSSEKLVAAIVKLLTIPDNDYNQLAKKALTVAKSFSWCKIIKKHLQIYNLLSNKVVDA